MIENQELLKNLISAKKNVKHKIMQIKRGTIDSENYFSETFKPITDPLNKIAEQNNKSFNENKNDLLDSSFETFLKLPPESRNYDKTYGLYYDKSNDKLKIGNETVTFINGKLHVFNKYFPWTIGLWSLLCEKNPKGATFEDIEAYYEILKSTKVHLKPDGKPKSNSFFKWNNIIKPLYDRMKKEEKELNKEIQNIELNRAVRLNLEKFNKVQSSNKIPKLSNNSTPVNKNPRSGNNSFIFDSSTENLTSESFKFDKNQPPSSSLNAEIGLGLYKNTIPKTQLVYYDDPNELVTRLNLLESSKNAGNNGVCNEIISILEELRERNLIV